MNQRLHLSPFKKKINKKNKKGATHRTLIYTVSLRFPLYVHIRGVKSLELAAHYPGECGKHGSVLGQAAAAAADSSLSLPLPPAPGGDFLDVCVSVRRKS